MIKCHLIEQRGEERRGEERSRMHICLNSGLTRPTSDMIPSGRPSLYIPPDKGDSQKVSEKSAM